MGALMKENISHIYIQLKYVFKTHKNDNKKESVRYGFPPKRSSTLFKILKMTSNPSPSEIQIYEYANMSCFESVIAKHISPPSLESAFSVFVHSTIFRITLL